MTAAACAIIERPEVGVALTFFEAVRSPEVFVEVAARPPNSASPSSP